MLFLEAWRNWLLIYIETLFIIIFVILFLQAWRNSLLSYREILYINRVSLLTSFFAANLCFQSSTYYYHFYISILAFGDFFVQLGYTFFIRGIPWERNTDAYAIYYLWVLNEVSDNVHEYIKTWWQMAVESVLHIYVYVNIYISMQWLYVHVCDSIIQNLKPY